jgi:hypothetical protein
MANLETEQTLRSRKKELRSLPPLMWRISCFLNNQAAFRAWSISPEIPFLVPDFEPDDLKQTKDLLVTCSKVQAQINPLRASIVNFHPILPELSGPTRIGITSDDEKVQRNNHQPEKIESTVPTSLSFDSEIRLSEKEYAYQVILIINGCSGIDLDTLCEEDINKLIKKSKTPINIMCLKKIIDSLASTPNPIDLYKRYSETVKGSDGFKGFHKINVGEKGRVLFYYDEGKLYIRFGCHQKVYSANFN